LHSNEWDANFAFKASHASPWNFISQGFIFLLVCIYPLSQKKMFSKKNEKHDICFIKGMNYSDCLAKLF